MRTYFTGLIAAEESNVENDHGTNCHSSCIDDRQLQHETFGCTSDVRICTTFPTVCRRRAPQNCSLGYKNIVDSFQLISDQSLLKGPRRLGVLIVTNYDTLIITNYDTLVVTNNDKIAEQLHFLQMSVGAVPGPFDCWLTQRSLKTLHLRMQRHDENGRAIAKHLNESNKIDKVYYPGLSHHPHHELAKKQQLDPDGNFGFGAMISIDLGTLERASSFVKNLELFTLAESLGGVESLICHPGKMTHASISDEQRTKLGISDGLLRLSIGIEDVDDLIQDINDALESL